MVASVLQYCGLSKQVSVHAQGPETDLEMVPLLFLMCKPAAIARKDNLH